MKRDRLSPYKWRQQTKRVFDRDGGRCVMCGSDWWLTVHHKIKRSKGGSDEMENLILLCIRCHNAQHPEFQTQWSKSA